MISGKIILKSATKLTLDKRFGEIARQAPPTPPPRIHQQVNAIIPHSRQDLFGNRKANTLSIAQRLKKRSINYRRGPENNVNANRPFLAPTRPRVFQRLGFNNRRRGGGGGGNNAGANSYLFGGQSGLGIRLRGQGRIGGTRTFRSRTRGYLNNNTISRFSGYASRGNRNNQNIRGRGGRQQQQQRNGNNFNYNRSNRGRGGGKNTNRGRGGGGGGRGRGRGNNTNKNVSKEVLDTELDKYMSQTKLDNDSVEMNAL